MTSSGCDYAGRPAQATSSTLRPLCRTSRPCPCGWPGLRQTSRPPQLRDAPCQSVSRRRCRVPSRWSDEDQNNPTQPHNSEGKPARSRRRLYRQHPHLADAADFGGMRAKGVTLGMIIRRAHMWERSSSAVKSIGSTQVCFLEPPSPRRSAL